MKETFILEKVLVHLLKGVAQSIAIGERIVALDDLHHRFVEPGNQPNVVEGLLP